MSGPGFGIIPRRVARLALSRRVHAVLDVILCHASREGRRAYLSNDTIAREVGIDRSKVPLCVRVLEAKGVLEVVRGGGRGRANHYRIIPDEEALRESSQPAPQADATTTEDKNGAVFGTETTVENGAVSGSKTVPFSAQNGAVFGTPTERTESGTESPLRGGRAHTREGGSRSGSLKYQPALLLPLNGSKKMGGRRTNGSLEDYRPGPEIVAWAPENAPGVDPLNKAILNRFRDYYLGRGIKISDPEAAYRNWLTEESRRRRRRFGPGDDGRAVTGLATVLAMIGDG
jgi:DNA-binding MarR family transcriptional regulator